jgi:hypothetical protein
MHINRMIRKTCTKMPHRKLSRPINACSSMQVSTSGTSAWMQSGSLQGFLHSEKSKEDAHVSIPDLLKEAQKPTKPQQSWSLHSELLCIMVATPESNQVNTDNKDGGCTLKNAKKVQFEPPWSPKASTMYSKGRVAKRSIGNQVVR